MRWSALSRRVASQPSITGSDRSIRMMSGVVVDGALQRLHAVAGLDDVEAGELEVLAVHLARVRIVVHEQHAGTLGVLLVISVLWSAASA